jgi:hypothetical protein
LLIDDCKSVVSKALIENRQLRNCISGNFAVSLLALPVNALVSALRCSDSCFNAPAEKKNQNC